MDVDEITKAISRLVRGGEPVAKKAAKAKTPPVSTPSVSTKKRPRVIDRTSLLSG
jgi:hypothetical protein